ncbi:preprotein translocase subunit YajC [Clostridium sp. DJ247]|uniref:preprotein translocase subunit YajC n=1 Tax=Clostridium sp. DJ247 TaxID=2726188 RepID=UPI001623EC50|nr:preprotein translocase subunit YajC [Clostridium sp. DJ247]MBC2581150.1 preprotein translocase subunit YajC [Clostridium sp. DJ247]
MEALVPYIPLIFMLALFYLVIFIPEGRRKKNYKNLLESLKVNDEIITKGGIVGKIVNIQDKFIIVQTGPDRVRIKFDKTGVLNKIESVDKDV